MHPCQICPVGVGFSTFMPQGHGFAERSVPRAHHCHALAVPALTWEGIASLLLLPSVSSITPMPPCKQRLPPHAKKKHAGGNRVLSHRFEVGGNCVRAAIKTDVVLTLILEFILVLELGVERER